MNKSSLIYDNLNYTLSDCGTTFFGIHPLETILKNAEIGELNHLRDLKTPFGICPHVCAFVLTSPVKVNTENLPKVIFTSSGSLVISFTPSAETHHLKN